MMKDYEVFIAWIFFIFLCFPVKAKSSEQISEIDSLVYLLRKSQIDSIKIKLLLSIADTYDGAPFEMLKFSRKALDIARRERLERLEGLAYEQISLAYRKMGDYPKAIDQSFKALRIYDKLKLTEKTAGMQLQIGSHFSADKNYSKAIPYITRALESFEERKDTANLVLALINLGETYRLKGTLDSAAVLFEKCLELNQLFSSSIAAMVKGYAEGNLGMVYSAQGKDEEAVKLLKSSIELLGQLHDYYSVSVYQSALAKIYVRQGHELEGEHLFRSALEMAKREKLKEQIRDVSKDFSRFYEANNRFKHALELRKQYEVYHDSLVNTENVRKAEQLESKYWLDQKDANIKFLELENRNKYRTVVVLSIGTFILLVLLFFVYRLQVLRKRAYQKVAEQKDIIEKREKEKALLLKELNHRVKNNLQMVSSMFSLQAGQFRGKPAADALIAARRRIDALMLIHQKLYREDVDTHIKLADYIRELTDNLVYGFGKDVNLDLDLSSARLYIDSAIPLGIIINELLTNSLKYASRQGKTLSIFIVLKEESDKLRLTIADNGPGFPEGHDIKKSRSLGLKLVYSLIRQLHGELTQTNENGCRWEITLSTDKLQR